GIRGFHVTGVQTCALPIFVGLEHLDEGVRRGAEVEPVALPGELDLPRVGAAGLALDTEPRAADAEDLVLPAGLVVEDTRLLLPRSEERRVGKACRSRSWAK